jgi:hypothetical protein
MLNRAKTYNVACLVEDQEYTLYTCPDNCRTHMVLLYIVNTNGNTTIDVEWNRADGSHVHLLGGKNITSGDFIQISDSYIVLEAGDVVAATASSNASPHIDVMCTVEEYFLPNRTY